MCIKNVESDKKFQQLLYLRVYLLTPVLQFVNGLSGASIYLWRYNIICSHIPGDLSPPFTFYIDRIMVWVIKIIIFCPSKVFYFKSWTLFYRPIMT